MASLSTLAPWTTMMSGQLFNLIVIFLRWWLYKCQILCEIYGCMPNQVHPFCLIMRFQFRTTVKVITRNIQETDIMALSHYSMSGEGTLLFLDCTQPFIRVLFYVYYSLLFRFSPSTFPETYSLRLPLDLISKEVSFGSIEDSKCIPRNVWWRKHAERNHFHQHPLVPMKAGLVQSRTCTGEKYELNMSRQSQFISAPAARGCLILLGAV